MDISQAARALRAAGGGGFRRNLEAAEHKAAEQVAAHMKAAIPGGLPRSGGLAAAAAAATTFDVRSAGSSGDVGASIQVRSQYNLARMNSEGTFTHPVFGGSAYVEQSAGVHQGFLDEPFLHGEADFKRAAEAAVLATRAEIDRGI